MTKPANKGDQKPERSEEIDLTELRDFNFAENWTEPSAPSGHREKDSRHSGAKRDRRPARRHDRRPPGARDLRHREPRGGARQERGERRRRPAGSGERPAGVLLRQNPFDLQVFPDEPVLDTLMKKMRQSFRTYELFEIARLVLEKNNRFHINLRYRQEREEQLYQAIPGGLPFSSEEGAVDYVLRAHLDKFFEIEEVEVDPPTGSFQFVARCSITGKYLGPPNYHRYQANLLQHHQEHFPDMPIERFRSRIETVSDEEEIAKWLESMKKQNRYKVLGTAGEDALVFETIEDARAYLLQNKKNEIVKPVKSVRLPGKQVEEVSDPEIRQYLDVYIEYQRRFPLDTANSLRGRLRRQHFYVFKKGSRGVSYVCAVRRKQRRSDQVFSESIGELIGFLEKNEEIPARDLAEKMLGISPPNPESGEKLDPEVQKKLDRLHSDLQLLVAEGYVTWYSDGRLVLHPVAEVPAKEVSESKEKPSKEAESSDSEAESSVPAVSEPAEEKEDSKIELGAKDPEPEAAEPKIEEIEGSEEPAVSAEQERAEEGDSEKTDSENGSDPKNESLSEAHNDS